MNAVPEVTLVIEWENVRLSGEGRGEEMLRRVAEQLRVFDRVVEVIVVCDPEGAAVAELEALLTRRLGPPDTTPFGWRLVTAPGVHYYELKNRGAAEAQAPLLVIIDSDVIPEDGWLAAVVEPFADPNVHVVAGHSYIDGKGLYSRAVALGWFFPLRSQVLKRNDRGSHFFANNVAFRTDVLRSHPFACAADGATRGACSRLGRELVNRGFRICVTTAAQVSHPPPNGLKHFLVRAVADGRDEVLQWRSVGKSGWTLPIRIARRYIKRSSRSFGSIARHRRDVDLGLEQVPLAWGIMGSYFGIAVVGALATWIAPGPMSRRFRI